MMELPVEAILSSQLSSKIPEPLDIGRSREGRIVEAFRFGHGSLRISLIAGCHADEPVGPEMLRRLVRFLASRNPDDHLLSRSTWSIVPHANPDGERLNTAWGQSIQPAVDSRGQADTIYRLRPYLRSVVRELPGDDIEFGFPRDESDSRARPENRAVANFLAKRRPVDLHGSFHGMGFAPGPWFLLEPSWVKRTGKLRAELRGTVEEMGYRCFDIDRKGEKGFRRIDEGFSTRPDSAAMIAFFEARGDSKTARKFRPSSMEFVRSLGGDPLTLVSEMPLFLYAEPAVTDGQPARLEAEVARDGIRTVLTRLAESTTQHSLEQAASRLQVRGMPRRDQMRLQLAFLNAGLAAISRRNDSSTPIPE